MPYTRIHRGGLTAQHGGATHTVGAAFQDQHHVLRKQKHSTTPRTWPRSSNGRGCFSLSRKPSPDFARGSQLADGRLAGPGSVDGRRPTPPRRSYVVYASCIPCRLEVQQQLLHHRGNSSPATDHARPVPLAWRHTPPSVPLLRPRGELPPPLQAKLTRLTRCWANLPTCLFPSQKLCP